MLLHHPITGRLMHGADGKLRSGSPGDPCCCGGDNPCISAAISIIRSPAAYGECGANAAGGKPCGKDWTLVCKQSGTLTIGAETFTDWKQLNARSIAPPGITLETWAKYFSLAATNCRLFVAYARVKLGVTWTWDDLGGLNKDGTPIICGAGPNIIQELAGGITPCNDGTQTYIKAWEIDPASADYLLWLSNNATSDAFGPLYSFFFVPTVGNTVDDIVVTLTDLAGAQDCTPVTPMPPLDEGYAYHWTAIPDCEGGEWMVYTFTVELIPDPAPTMDVWQESTGGWTDPCVLELWTTSTTAPTPPAVGTWPLDDCCTVDAPCTCPEGLAGSYSISVPSGSYGDYSWDAQIITVTGTPCSWSSAEGAFEYDDLGTPSTAALGLQLITDEPCRWEISAGPLPVKVKLTGNSPTGAYEESWSVS
jgi:hypothetical protein